MARKKANIHYIYKTTCNVTGRWYIGMHSTTKLEDGYMGSGKILRYSIRKYGVENHTKEILEFFETREELIFREQEIVTKELISDGKCMNLREGGTGGWVSKEVQLKCSKAGGDTTSQKIKNDDVFRLKFSSIISDTLKDKVYNKDCPIDICSTELYREGENLIFCYKAVPATAATMSSYPYLHALILNKEQVLKGE